MLNTVVRLELYNVLYGSDDDGYTYDTTPIVLDNFSGLTIQFGLERRKDSIRFNIKNYSYFNISNYNKFYLRDDISIGIKDKIIVYAYNYPMTGTLNDHLLMTATVNNFTYDTSSGTAMIQITAYDRTEVMLNSYMFASYSDVESYGNYFGVPYMLLDIMTKIKSYNNSDKVYAYKDYSGTSTPGVKGAYDMNGAPVAGYTGYVRAYKKAAYDSSGNLLSTLASTIPDEYDENGEHKYYFKKVPYAESFKAFFEHAVTLSAIEFTGDEEAGSYLFWVDDESNLHWQPKTFSIYNVTLGSEIILYEKDSTSINLPKDVGEVVNAIIMNCGTDPNDNGILTLEHDASSMGKYGARWKYIAKTNIAEEVRQKELESGTWTNDSGDSISGTPNSPKYLDSDNYPSAYPWTINSTGEDIDAGWSYISKSTTVSSDSTYKDYFRRVCKAIGKKMARRIINESIEPKYKANYELEIGNNYYSAGDMIKIVIPSFNISTTDELKLRIMGITHSFNNSRWITTLEIEEDSDEVVETMT